MHVPIEPNREYKPSEIFKNGFILNNKGKPDYFYVLELIRAGKLRARNVCLGRWKHYRVLGRDIITWKQSTYNIATQPEQYERAKGERRPYPQAAIT